MTFRTRADGIGCHDLTIHYDPDFLAFAILPPIMGLRHQEPDRMNFFWFVRALGSREPTFRNPNVVKLSVNLLDMRWIFSRVSRRFPIRVVPQGNHFALGGFESLPGRP
jgi:hypothetical protein